VVRANWGSKSGIQISPSRLLPANTFVQYQVAGAANISKLMRIADPAIVTFTDHGAEDDLPEVPLPSSKLLALHATCARVAHMSGAAEYLNFCDREREFAPELKADGSMAMVLEEALRTAVLTC
jgi:hypothetical protein